VKWLAGNWFDLAQLIAIALGIAITTFAFRLSIRTTEMSNIIALAELRRDTWQTMVDHPELARIYDQDPSPLEATEQERRFLVSVMSLLHVSFEMQKPGGARNLSAHNLHLDTAMLLRLPIPQYVWSTCKIAMPPSFVAFTDQAVANYVDGLNGGGPSA
jgi:hypothetical protein